METLAFCTRLCTAQKIKKNTFAKSFLYAMVAYMKTKTMVRRCYFVTRLQADALSKRATQLGISVAELLRRILDRWLNEDV